VNSIDLVSLVEQKSGIRLVRKATTDSGEYWGFCPFCKAGDNRFHVWPNSGRPHWWCRVCLTSGDAVQFLRAYCGLSYFDACAELGIDPDLTGYTPGPVQQSSDTPPPAQWQATAKTFVERAERFLWHPKSQEGQQALVYLRGRGLSDETIRRARLGYCPLGQDGRWYSDTFEHWGLDPEQLSESQREKGCVRIPNGIVIPWCEGDRIWKLAIKRPDEKMDYGQVMGSCEGLYGVDTVEYGKPVMMVEGEFDCLSVLQEAGDLVGVVATGSTTRARCGRWVGELGSARYVLQSYDDDSAGDDGAAYWQAALSHCMRWAPWNDRWEASPRFKDPNDILRSQDAFKAFTDTTLRGWIEQGMWAAELEPLYDPPITLARETEPLVPVVKPDYSRHIQAQEQFERLCISERVNTPEGPGRIWEMAQLREHIERGRVRVTLDSRLGDGPPGATELFAPEVLEPVVAEELLDLSF